MGKNRAWEWFMGRTPAMVARQERTRQHPVRAAVTSGLMFGGTMAVIMGIRGGWLGVALGLASGAAFGPALVWWAPRGRDRR